MTGTAIQKARNSIAAKARSQRKAEAYCASEGHNTVTSKTYCVRCAAVRSNCNDCGVAMGYVPKWQIAVVPHQCIGCIEARREQYLASGSNYPLDNPDPDALPFE